MDIIRIAVVSMFRYFRFYLKALELTELKVEILGIFLNVPNEREFQGISVFPYEEVGVAIEQNPDYILVDDNVDEKLIDIIKTMVGEKAINHSTFMDIFFPNNGEANIVRECIKEVYPRPNTTALEMDEFSYEVPEIASSVHGVKCTIGKYCSIASGVKILLGMEHRMEWNTTYPFNWFFPQYGYIEGHPNSKGDVIIGNDVWIGADARILSGITIGDGAVIASNSVVTKDVLPYTIVGGNPAKVIRRRFSDEIIERFMEIRWWDWPDDKVEEAISLLQSDKIDDLYEYYKNFSGGE